MEPPVSDLETFVSCDVRPSFATAHANFNPNRAARQRCWCLSARSALPVLLKLVWFACVCSSFAARAAHTDFGGRSGAGQANVSPADASQPNRSAWSRAVNR
eukprot:1158171-Pelagomonas_calceolata.AAC.5